MGKAYVKSTGGEGFVGDIEKSFKDHAKSKAVAKKARGNYSIFKIEGDKKTRLKHNLTASEMRHQLKTNPEYRGGEGYGFGGRRTYIKK